MTALNGRFAAQGGAAEVVVTDLQDATLAVARKMGATATVNVRTDAGALEPWLADKGQFDLTVECSAATPAIRQAIAATRPLGTIIQVGVTGDTPIPLNMLVGKEIGLIGTHSFPLEQAAAATAAAAARSQSVKVQIAF